MTRVYDRDAPKKATNLTLNTDLLKKARSLGINLSATVEQTLEEIVRKQLAERWLAENREAIDAYNDAVDRHGVFSDGIRRF